MGKVNNIDLNMDIDVFNVALDKLQNEGHIKLTKQGINYIESTFGIEKELTSNDKIKYVIKNVAYWDYKQ